MPLAPHQFWQTVFPAGTFDATPADGFSDLYPASLPDGRQIALPVRVLPGDGSRAVATMIVNQASFAVEDALSDAMAASARAYAPEVVIGVPTLGLPLANALPGVSAMSAWWRSGRRENSGTARSCRSR